MRRRHNAFAFVAVLILLVLSACGRGGAPDSYESTSLRSSFLEGCETQARTDGVDQPAPFCRCTYERLSDQIEFTDFKAVHDRLSEEPGPLPGAWQPMIEACATS